MHRTHTLMGDADWQDDERLNDTDRAILEELANGRMTTGALADTLDKHAQTIRDRLRWLKEWNYVETYHETTGLHELQQNNNE